MEGGLEEVGSEGELEEERLEGGLEEEGSEGSEEGGSEELGSEVWGLEGGVSLHDARATGCHHAKDNSMLPIIVRGGAI